MRNPRDGPNVVADPLEHTADLPVLPFPNDDIRRRHSGPPIVVDNLYKAWSCSEKTRGYLQSMTHTNEIIEGSKAVEPTRTLNGARQGRGYDLTTTKTLYGCGNSVSNTSSAPHG